MGAKGSNTTTSQGTNTYTPNPAAYASLLQALSRAQGAANQPFNLPQAPVAGFSPQQQQAFGEVGAAQGAAQPYINQAANYFGQSAQGPNVSQFFNPFAGAVTGQLENIFGKQAAQNTGNLVQTAGGVGADRVAVGQADLANQQGLAAGQTLAGVYAPSLSAAEQEQQLLQSAGYGMGVLGPAAQQAQLQGANALLGTGGLQQQLSQAQLNSPYQLQVAQSMFPYQQAQFLAGITGALAPGFGGTTAGQSQTTGPSPSLLSQILGSGLGITGILGQTGAFGSSGYLTGGKGGGVTGDYPGQNRGGRIGYDDGGVVGDPMLRMMEINRLADSGQSNPFSPRLPSGVSDQPLNISQSTLPSGQVPAIRPIVPQLNFPQSHSDSGGGLGGIIGAGLKLAGLEKGGRIDPKKFDGANPHAFAEGGAGPDGTDPELNNALLRTVGNPLYQGSEDDFLNGRPSPLPVGKPDSLAGVMPAPAAVVPGPAPMPPEDGQLPAEAEPTQGSNPFSPQPGGNSFINSPWSALTAAGFGMMASRSPFPGVAIGEGGLMGMKQLEQQRAAQQKQQTIDQAARRLDQEAQFHQDQYTKMTPYQKGELGLKEKMLQLGRIPPGYVMSNGQLVALPGGPADPKQLANIERAKMSAILGGGSPDSGGAASAAPPTPQPGEGTVQYNERLAASGPYDYSQGAPKVMPGMDLPEPKPTFNRSTDALKTDAIFYMQTGKLPAGGSGFGNSPLAMARQTYANAVENYGIALGLSRGYTPDQIADMRRTAPGMLRFILGPDGRSTVALGTAVRHLDLLNQLSDAYQRSDMPLIARLQSAVATQFGSAAATNIDTTAKVIGSEIMKAIGVAGAGGEHEREAVANIMSSKIGTAQMIGAVQTLEGLLGGQLEGRERQAAAVNMPTDKFKNMIGERPYEILDKARKGAAVQPAAALSPVDQQALSWAKANPNDPRAAKIMQKLGGQ